MKNRDSNAPIAIVGVGCRFPPASDAEKFWEDLILPGRTAFADVPEDRWHHESLYSASARDVDKAWVKKGSFIEDWKSFAAMHYGISPRRLEVMDPQQRMLIEATRWAIQDAGYETRSFDRSRTGTYFGVSVSEFKNVAGMRLYGMMLANGDYGAAAGSQALRDAMMQMGANIAPMRAFTLAGSLLNMNAASVAQTFDLGGPAYTIDAACASSSVALHDAVIALRTQAIDVALAGGVYINLTPDNLVAFTKIGAISPTGACRPFDAKADGFVQSDAVAVFYLKRLDDALADRDRIHGVILGSGCNNDGRGEGPMTPRVGGQLQALKQAYADAGVSPATVAYFEAHGTATSIGDPAEVEALGQLLSEHDVQEPVGLGSVKGNIGHAMSAAGVAGLAKALKMIEKRTIPPQPGFETPNQKLGLERLPLTVAKTQRSLEPRGDAPLRVGVSSFGFGGTNSHLVIEAPPAVPSSEARTPELRGRPQAVLVTAPTEALLSTAMDELAGAIEADDSLALDEIAFTLNARRRHERYRVVVTASSKKGLVEALRRGPAKLIDAGEEPTPPRIAFLFPGQGAQQVGLLRDVKERFGAFAERFAQLDVGVADALYGAEATEEALAATEVCQPAMAALGLSMAHLLETVGVAADVSLGHSLGEFAALAHAGVLDPEATVQLVQRRGELMRDLDLPDPGAMAAVLADADTVKEAVAWIDDVVVANHNHPRQVSISGTTAGVEAASKKLREDGFEVRPLVVSHAFHSPLMGGIREGMEKLLDEVTFSEPRHTVVSCISDAEPRTRLLDHATAPVQFVRALEQTDADVYVQVGAGGMLTSFARASIKADKTVTLAGSEPDGGLSFLRGLAHLAAYGAPVDWSSLYPDCRVVSLPETPLERQDYWIVKETPQPKPVLDGPFRDGPSVSLEASSEAATPELATLFAKQTELLSQHAEILAAQHRMLTGDTQISVEEIEAKVQAVIAEPTTATASKPEPTPEVAAVSPAPAIDPGAEQAKVNEIVAQVSAFPIDRIRPDQKLVTDLGFDSLMVQDLAGALEKAFPGAEIPVATFSMETTVQDITTALRSAPAPSEEAEPSEVAPVRRYRVTAHARARAALGTHDVQGETWLVTEADNPPAIAEALEKRGATVIRVRFVKNGAATPTTLSPGLNVWPLSYVEGLAEALPEIQGMVHAAGLGVSNVADFINPVLTLHPVIKQLTPGRFATITQMGGRLGLEASPSLSKNVLQSALSGYAKALSRERAAVVKTIDISDTTSAEAIVEELLAQDHTVEVGLGAGRVVARLEEAPERTRSRRISAEDVVAITGGAGEIGRLIAAHVLTKNPKAVLLLGRRKENDDIKALLKSLGPKAFYVSADVTDAGHLLSATRSLVDRLGSPTVVIHAAGAIEDAPASKKTLQSVERVMDVKIRGLQAILRAFPKLVDLVLFTSWAGRFGNAGQVDYSAANGLLDHVAIAGVGATRAVAIAWPPWASTAMVASIPGPVRKAMKAEGVTFLEDEEGLEAFDAIFETGATGVEVVGRDLPHWETQAAFTEHFDQRHAYLEDHRLRGRPVVPLASATDLIGWGFSQTADGTGALVIEDLTLGKGLFGGDRAKVSIAGKKMASGDRAQVTVRTDAVAYRARVRTAAAELSPFSIDGAQKRSELSLDSFYGEHTFHGPSMRGIERVRKVTDEGIEGLVKPAGFDVGRPFTVDPLILDGSFQLAAYWLASFHGRVGFPIGFDRLTVMRPFGDRPVVARVRLRQVDDELFAGDIFYTDDLGTPFALLENVRGRFAEVRDDMEVDRASYDIAAFPEVEQLDQRFQMAELIGLRNPYFHVHAGTAKNKSVIDGVEMLNYSSYNYLGYSGHPEVVEAAQQATAKYGTSVSASRVASGERPLHRELEQKIARHVGVDDSIVYVSGHATNVTTIGHLFGREDLIIHDSLIHDSILQGIHLSGAARRPYPHGDLAALEQTLADLRKSYRRVLICAEGIYSMDGDVCDLPRMIELKKQYRTLLLVDEAHSIGVLGESGRGIAHHFAGVDPRDVDLWMGTLSKSFASCGGYIAGSDALVRYLKYTAPGFVYSAGITPANAAAALKALELMHREPENVERLRSRSRFFLEGARKRGLDTGLAVGAAVVPVIVGNSMECMKLSEALAKRKINVQPIVYPAVEDDAARLRFFISSLHTEEELTHTLDVVTEELKNVRQETAEATRSASAPGAGTER